MVMTTNDYLTYRVDNQIDWYDKKSSWNQRLYKRLQILQIVAAASIPIFAGFITSETRARRKSCLAART
jgi:hypothetical protein